MTAVREYLMAPVSNEKLSTVEAAIAELNTAKTVWELYNRDHDGGYGFNPFTSRVRDANNALIEARAAE